MVVDLVVVKRREAADGEDVVDEHEDGHGEERRHDGHDHEVETAAGALGAMVGDAVACEG